MNKYRFFIKTGPYAGKVFDGMHCNGRAHPDAEPDFAMYGDGIYIPELNLRMKKQYLPSDDAKHFGETVDYEDLVIAFDKYGNEIFIGDVLYASINKEVCKVTVLKLGAPYHQGCGWMARKMSVLNEDTGKRSTLNDPSATIKIL